MKKLLLFALSAILICGCSKNENSTPPTVDIFSVNSRSLVVSGQGGRELFGIQSTRSWTISGGTSWCTPSETSGDASEVYGTYPHIQVETKYIYFNIEGNTTNKSRSATFTIENGEQSIEITITQGVISTVVTVTEPGTLQQILTEQNLLETTELKIKGVLNETDFDFLKTVLTLRYLDISDVNLKELPNEAFSHTLIKHIILPRSLKVISEFMFASAETTTVQMFDEVITIEDFAFSSCKIESSSYNGGLYLSSKLQTIGKNAFSSCSNLHVLKFPASLEVIESQAFYSLHDPDKFYPSLEYIFFEKGSKLKTIGAIAFNSAFAYDGIIYMQHCTQIETFEKDAFDGNISKFYLGTKTPPQGGFPFDEFNPVSSWTIDVYVPSLYIDAYKKFWEKNYGVQGRFFALEYNMPEDK
ncbi:leucine-rich repeat protein [uncultured Alistipes sp.]|uniref:leucine-rich repeat protein n=1 Tax=uncultured Alistipes sp. TaxID=538949 RepID=UPI002612E34D|nr:leucine-rich repeat protein [uncultured Alistipes sp.]